MINQNSQHIKRKKPRFLRQDWHKKIKLGSQIKKKRKWRAAKGGDSKVRLERLGHARRPKVGWGNRKQDRGKIKGLIPVRIENLKQLENISKEQGIIIASIGRKKKLEIISKAKEKSIIILNKYKPEPGQNAVK